MKVTAALLVLCASFSAASARELTFEDRVRAQEAIERVYYAHQIGATKPFEEAVPRSVIERKVRRLLERSAAIERSTRTRITPLLLRSELSRIARGTKLPDRVEEIYAALDNDPVRIAETIARSSLVERLGAKTVVTTADVARARERSSTQVDVEAYGSSVPHPDTSWSSCIADNSWSPGILGAFPSTRWASSVWTGTEMLIWGGGDTAGGTSNPRTDGWRYDPALDSWRPISSAGSPAPRFSPSAIWTGSQMVVWGGVIFGSGGVNTYFNTGGKYDPVADVWTPVSTIGAPSGRSDFAMVWTGSVVVVWGGADPGQLATGGRYDPVSDTWLPTNTGPFAPVARGGFTGVWTGTRMIIWGGYVTDTGMTATGARYDPVLDSWSATSVAIAPVARQWHTAVWSGTKMIVWGGYNDDDGDLNSGGQYDPVTDHWTATSTANAPFARWGHGAVWAGSRMVVWGGGPFSGTNTGARYDPATDIWEPTSTNGAPSARSSLSIIWTGSRVVIWGGGHETGGQYDPVADTWTPTSVNPGPETREERTTIWTGTEMIIWGGVSSDAVILDSGAAYDPALDSWRTLPTAGAPRARTAASAVWTGTEMIVWGGNFSDLALNTGGRYNPTANTWAPTSTVGAPSARREHTAVWTGTEVLIWGGDPFSGCNPGGVQATGARYDPAADTWSAISVLGAPPKRRSHSAVWTGSEMIVWGGLDEGPAGGGCTSFPIQSGSRYDPATDSWEAVTTSNAPALTTGPSAVWTGTEMIVWGGQTSNGQPGGGRYDPSQDAWLATSLSGAPARRSGQSAVWDGNKMIVWGGQAGLNTNTGGRYDPVSDTWTPTALAGAPYGRRSHSAVWADSVMLVWDGGFHNGSRYGSGNADADSDGIADACDACPNDPINDLDGDGFCGAVDNCDFVSNLHQLDSDADGVGDACDVCPSVVDANQLDGDGDGQGDACDCRPADPGNRSPSEAGPLSVAKSGTTISLSWPALPGAHVYAILRGDLASQGSGQYGSCRADGVQGTTFDDSDVPSPGQGYFYLVQGENYECGLGTLGADSTEQKRVNANPAACAGASFTDTFFSTQSIVFGTLSGAGNTLTSNNAYLTIREVLSTGSPPANRYSQLEGRFTFNVPAGTATHLYVEGLRTNSTDGDDFAFECSTNGGVSFTPLGLTLPTADDNVGRAVVLPSGTSGSVIIRIVDTDRTAGHQTLDIVAVDQMWIRSVP